MEASGSKALVVEIQPLLQQLVFGAKTKVAAPRNYGYPSRRSHTGAG